MRTRILAALLAAALAAQLSGCASDRPPDPPNFMRPQDVLAELVGKTLKGGSSQAAGATFYESAERARFRTTVFGTGQLARDPVDPG